MELYQAWLYKANNDFRGAELLFANALNDLAIYHAQQCAEKSLKGYLIFKGVNIPKTHSLDKLLDLCKSVDTDFDKIDYQVFELDGLDVRYRYPLAVLLPEDDEVEIAIAQSETVNTFIKEKCV